LEPSISAVKVVIRSFAAIFNMPAYYRVVAVNTATSLLTTTVSVNITVS
jgi:hypothetical protein